MSQFIYTLILFIGGILFYAINTGIFVTKNLNHFSKLFLFISAFIPVIGFLVGLGFFLWCIMSYQKNGFEFEKPIVIRDTRLNRFLFDDVDWNDYDIQIRTKKEKENQDKQFKDLMNEKERRSKLVKGLEYE